MSKHDRKEVAKRLREQIEKTTDPEQLIKLTREYNRLTNPRYGKKAVKEAKPSKNPRSLRDLHPGWGNMSDDEVLLQHLVLEIEKKRRERRKEYGRELTEAEKQAISTEVKAEAAGYKELKNDG